MMGWVVPTLALSSVGIGIWPLWKERRKDAVGAAERTGRGCEFAELSQGITAYRWHGPTRGPVIVAVHGLTSPSPVFDDLIPYLTHLGYRVLTYDLYGRGLSDAPEGDQDATFFRQQLRDLLKALSLNEDITLMGYSMGGMIVADYAATHKHQISRVIQIAPAGIDVVETDEEKRWRDGGMLGDILAAWRLETRLRETLETAEMSASLRASIEEQFLRKGYLPAVHSSRRHMLLQRQEAEHRVLGRADLPVIAIWAEDDAVIRLSSSGQLAQWNRATRQEVIKGAGHGLMQTHAAELGAILTDILAGQG